VLRTTVRAIKGVGMENPERGPVVPAGWLVLAQNEKDLAKDVIYGRLSTRYEEGAGQKKDETG